jgi:hypothetical protein
MGHLLPQLPSHWVVVSWLHPSVTKPRALYGLPSLAATFLEIQEGPFPLSVLAEGGDSSVVLLNSLDSTFNCCQ